MPIGTRGLATRFAALAAKAEWLSETLGELERRIADG
jgi:hypothetical protein